MRGGKRQIRRVQRWREARLEPDLNHLRRFGQEYVKLTIDPWYRLVKRQPPVWLRREMTLALLDVYESWRRKVEALPEVEYLRVWLSWPNFIDSQVVMATGRQAQHYQDVFLPVAEPKGLPSELGPQLLARLSEFEWQECLSEYPVYKDDLTADELHWLFKRRYRPGRLYDGTEVYWIEQGRVWVGQKLTNKEAPSMNL